jgi:DNA-binding transcriptional MocR family regulator
MSSAPADNLHWEPQIERGKKPLYLAIADALSDDLRNGRIAPGARLPAQRDLAAALDVDLTTITRAYGEARRRGLLSARVGRGSFVAAPAAAQAYGAPTGAPVDMTMNMPPLFDDDALSRRLWRGVAELEQRGGLGLLLRYQDPGGAAEDRAAGAAWLQTRLPGLTPDRTLVAAGAQSALVAVLASLTNPGDTICAEALCYPGLRAAAAQLGLAVAGVEMDREGILPDALARVAREVGPKALCCTPTLQNPTTATMSLDRRNQIIAVARRYRFALIEDDAYGRLPAAPEPALASLAPDLTWHIAGLAKLLSPALRIAYVATPDTRNTVHVAARLRAIIGMASPISAALATRWIRTGLADEVLVAIRAETRQRRALAASILGPSAAEPAEAFHLWLGLPPPWTRGAFQAALRTHEVSVVASDAFVTTGQPPEAVRVSLGAPTTRGDLAHALRAVTQVMAQEPALVAYV